MDSEAMIRMEHLVYSIVYKRVTFNFISSCIKKTGPPDTARFLHFAKYFTYRACLNR